MNSKETISHCHISQEIEKIFTYLKDDFLQILQNNLIGIYIHGSIALNDFRKATSDIDMLVVTNDCPSDIEKEKLIQSILKHHHLYPQKGLEISFVRLEDCQYFVYPTPFDLHFSNYYLEEAKKDTFGFAKRMHGLDPDLACHFTLTRECGIQVYGPLPKDIFMPVPKKYYIQSILHDLKDGKTEIYSNPYYYFCNLCRTLAYLEDDLILSKNAGIHLAIINHYPFSPLFLSSKYIFTKERLDEIYQTYMQLILEAIKKNHIAI